MHFSIKLRWVREVTKKETKKQKTNKLDISLSRHKIIKIKNIAKDKVRYFYVYDFKKK